MSSKKPSSETLVEIWRKADAQAETKRAEANAICTAKPVHYDAGGRAPSSANLLAQLQSELAVAVADDERDRAEVAAVRALHAEALASGDELVRTADVKHLLDDLLSLDAEIKEHEAAVAATRARYAKRIENAQLAELTLQARRRGAKLPFLPALPPLTVVGKPHSVVLADAIKRGLVGCDHTAQIAQLRAKLGNVAADLREQELEKARAEKDAEDERVNRARMAQIERDKDHAKEKQKRDEAEAERRRRAALAEEYLKREST